MAEGRDALRRFPWNVNPYQTVMPPDTSITAPLM